MMGPRQVEQGVLFYNFSLDAHVPADHLLSRSTALSTYRTAPRARTVLQHAGTAID